MNTDKAPHELTNDEIIERVNAWQTAGFVHPMTCLTNSKHPNLILAVENGKVVLKCPECRYIQKYIPPSILEVTPSIIQQEKERLIRKGFKF